MRVSVHLAFSKLSLRCFATTNKKLRVIRHETVGDDVKLAFLDVKAFERLLGSCIERMEKNCAIYLKELAHNEGRQNV